MSTKTELALEALKVSELPQLLGFEQKQKELVVENPYIEIVDNKTYEQACKHRTNLLKGRTSLQAQETLIVSKLTNFRKEVGAKTKELIEITLPSEEKQQAEVKRYELIKQKEKEAADNAEKIRVEKIKSDIENIETYCYEVIQKMTFDNIKSSTEAVDQSLNAEYDFEEYDILFDQVKDRVAKQLMDKTNDITARENQRLENEAMKKEIFEVRVNRLKELGYILHEGCFMEDEGTISYQEQYVLNATAVEFETVLTEIKSAQQKSEQAKKDAELKVMNDQQFEVRKSRLAEIGILYDANRDYFRTTPDEFASLCTLDVYNATIIEFEEMLVGAKKSISDAKAKQEAELKAKDEADKKAIADKKKKEAEDKARVKRLASDKEIIAKSFDVYFSALHLETENQEIKDFIDSANSQIENLQNDLLTQLNEL